MLEKYITSMIDNKQYNRSNGHFTRHLRAHGITYQEYYETYITGRKEFCPFCGRPRTLRQKNHTYTDTCGARECASKRISAVRLAETPEQVAATNARRRRSNLEKYGVEYACQTEVVKHKMLEANTRIIADGKTSKQIQQEKARATKRQRYGDEFYNNRRAIIEAKSHHSIEQKNVINARRRATCLVKYGVENYFLRPESRELISQRMARGNASIKPFVLPSGKTVGLRGVEHLALTRLLETLKEDDIIVHDAYAPLEIPILMYINVNEHKASYYPDIYIPSQNRIIEVKSTWWFDGTGGDKYAGRLENNMRKRQAALDAGYKFEFWIMSNKSKDFEIR